MDIIIKDDCSVEIGSPTELSAEEAQNNDKDKDKDRDSARGKQHRAPLSRIGSTPEYLDPDYHMDAHIWDCCNIIMTRLVTDLNWTTDGVTITGWNAGGYQSYHGEFSCGPGWYPVNSYLVQNGGGTGDVYIGVHSHAEWGYQGVFDCSGSYYSNTFDNYIWGDILSRGSCDYGFYLRHTATNWHLQIQCYNPLITKFDQWY